MKVIENTSSTHESMSDLIEDKKVSNEKMVALLKFVYYERKSIKQAATYLSLNYNSAKRIIKKFRKNKIVLDNVKSGYEKLALDLKPKYEQKPIVQQPVIEQVKPVVVANTNTNTGNGTGDVFGSMMTEISQLGTQLFTLNQEIVQNQQALQFLVSYYTYTLMKK